MYQNSSPDGGNYVFIDDLDRLDTFTPGTRGGFTQQDVQDVKELIEFTINNPKGSKRWGSGWNNQFGVNQGEVYDEKGYFIINLLHSPFIIV